MAQYFTDFSEYSDSVDLTGQDWTARGDSPATFEKRSDSEGDYLFFETISENNIFMSWDDVGTHDVVDIYFEVTPLINSWNTGENELHAIGRGQNSTASNVNAVGSGIRGSSGDVPLYTWIIENGSYGFANSFTKTIGDQVTVSVRMQVTSGDEINSKFWETNNQSEPTSWEASVTDSTITSAGWAGFGWSRGSTKEFRIDKFGVGTDGDPVPRFAGLVEGQVHQSGSGVQGARVMLIDMDNEVVIGTDTTDSNGNYAIEINHDFEGHVIAQYDDGTNLYNSESSPYIDVTTAL